MKKVVLVILLMSASLLLAACSYQSAEPTVLRIAVLPVLDTLPLYVAEAQGYFEDEGLQVEFVPVNSAPERDQLMQTGQIDGMLNELVSTILYNRDETRVVVLRFARTATSTYPLFRILAAPGSGINTVTDLAGVPIGISDGTVIEYTTDRLLTNAGLTQDQINKISVPKIPDRMALLSSGELLAANLPDPVASLAVLNGSTVILDDTTLPQISNSIYSFSVDAVENKTEALRAFLIAVEKAVADINADKTKWNDLLIERNLVPAPILESYTIPDYPTAGVPDEDQFNDALQWLLDKNLLENVVSYPESVDASLLPE